MTAAGEWETPLGPVMIHRALAQKLLLACRELSEDEEAHSIEHSLEVILPLLQTCRGGLKIVPIIVGALDLRACREVALEIGEELSKGREPYWVVISNDMSHYDTDEICRGKDRYALRAIESLDEEALIKAVREYRITMCGIMPVYMLLSMKDKLGIKKAQLVDYATSADATGDRDRVVGYAGFIFE